MATSSATTAAANRKFGRIDQIGRFLGAREPEDSRIDRHRTEPQRSAIAG